MRIIKGLPFFFLLFMLVHNSCTVRKRIYMSGYHTTWNTGKHVTIKHVNSRNQINTGHESEALTKSLMLPLIPVQLAEENIIAAVGRNSDQFIFKPVLPDEISAKWKVRTVIFDEEYDLIILRDGQEIKAKVLEIGSTEVRYQRFNDADGPIFVKRKSEIFMIRYPNGTKTVFEPEEEVSAPKVQTTTTSQVSSASGNSQTIALLLCIFTGILGVHRFYLGHIGIGFLYLFTVGLCGIGWIIDIILIVNGSLKPKDGEYEDLL